MLFRAHEFCLVDWLFLIVLFHPKLTVGFPRGRHMVGLYQVMYHMTVKFEAAERSKWKGSVPELNRAF